MPAQTVAANDPVSFAESRITAPAGSIVSTDADTLTLEPGIYKVQFVANATAENSTDQVGAVLATSAGPVEYTAMSQPAGDTLSGRVVLDTILTPTAQETVQVVNQTGNPVTYTDAVLTAVRLA